VVLNLLGLAVLISGALVLNELRRGLIDARIDGLVLQAEVIANVINEQATVESPAPALNGVTAGRFLLEVFVPRGQRARLFDVDGNPIADSYVVADRVERTELPPLRAPGDRAFTLPAQHPIAPSSIAATAREELESELARAMTGERASGMRHSETGQRVVSVSVPIRRVRAVLGVLTLEAGDVDEIIAKERQALAPFILIAIGVTLISSLLLTSLIARPILQLATAADRVRLSRARAIALPELSRRNDEIGNLTRSLEGMTHSLTERMDAIESFAADVAHEIRNPLTSIRSAVETMELVKDDAPRERLLGILKQDVSRLDRLVTDISNASRLDAELGREDPRRVDLARLIGDVVRVYEDGARESETSVRLVGGDETLNVMGREGPLSQVFRNLIDNARSFSPPGGEVRVILGHNRGRVVGAVEDDGPGIPPENLETVFERFYTSRPKGAAFGGNSGLGLSIARQIVEAHGGTIRAENRQDEAGTLIGARFVVDLPEARA
jgi:two-component system sensor histidine kinase ChvG